MSKEYIDKAAFIEYLGFENTIQEREENIGEIVTLEDFDRQPVADVVEVKHGEWISDDADILFHCSECEAQISTSWDYEGEWIYCPNCGAKMDGKRREK